MTSPIYYKQKQSILCTKLQSPPIFVCVIRVVHVSLCFNAVTHHLIHGITKYTISSEIVFLHLNRFKNKIDTTL